MKTKIGTEVAHVTRDSDITFKVKTSTCRRRGHIVAASRTACYYTILLPAVIEHKAMHLLLSLKVGYNAVEFCTVAVGGYYRGFLAQ